jgi:hypothetical protein
MRKWVAIATAVLLAGCAAERQRHFDEAAAVCRAQIPAQVGNYTRRQACLRTAAYDAGFRGPDQDLINATNEDLAEKVDRGDITITEANLRSAQVRYEIAQRAAAAQAERSAAAAAVLSAMPRPQPYVLPTYQMSVPQPWSATCTRMGNYTTCNGN